MEADDWIDIAPAAGPHADNVRRASSVHPLDFFRGRDFSGRYIFSLSAETDCQDLAEPPKLNGIDVSLERRQPHGARLVLTLQEREQFDIFRALSDHLLRATADQALGANSSGLRLVLQRLSDWHDMLRRRRDDLLSMPEIIGLAGELLFLRDEILPRTGAAETVAAWRGAHADEQDFAIGNWQVEVKTQLSTADQRLIISSEAQLDTAGSRLILCHQAFAATPETGQSFTLNSLVEGLSIQFSHASWQIADSFQVALEAFGYVPRQEYDQPIWLLADRRLFEVREAFPRIIPRNLPAGVHRVSYSILLSACEPFAVGLDETMTSIFP
ncbi:MAG: motif protein [Rubritepida sp.]|nr:motif protein [Rubritepida sp.]